jgi:hypothetical protein
MGQGTLPSPTAGSRIQFPESLLMLKTILREVPPNLHVFFPICVLNRVKRNGAARVKFAKTGSADFPKRMEM